MLKALGVSLLVILAAGSADAQQIGDVFYIALENHNFTQPTGLTTTPEQLLGNPAAPFLNSLVNGASPFSAQVSYASNYQNVVSNGTSIHPSEPNYVWQVSGAAGPLNDADPYANSPNNLVNAQNLGQLLQQKYSTAGWKTYQEDIDLAPASGTVNQPGSNSLTSIVAPQSQWTVPTSSFSGKSSDYTNAYNGSDQYNYAAKHDPFVFFTSTNGGTATAPDFSPSNPETQYYAPLQQLQPDLSNNTLARFSWITPDQYNDMHSSLSGGFKYGGTQYTGDQAAVAEGDNFLSMIIPEIINSQAYQKNGVIVIWNDETEGETPATANQYASTEIIISKLAKGNDYTNNIPYTHSSDLVTWQNVFGVAADGPYLGAAGGANSLADLFRPGVIPSSIPESGTWAMMLIGFAGLGLAAAFGRKSAARTSAALG
jgi:hypothetical protein